MKLKKQEIEQLLNECLQTGADFAEFFIENTNKSRMTVMSGEVTSITTNNINGVGIRIVKNTDQVYGYTNDLNLENLKEIIADLRVSFSDKKLTKQIPLGNEKPYLIHAIKRMNEVSNQEKLSKLIKLSNLILKESDKVVQAVAVLQEWEQHILVANTLGIYQTDVRPYARVMLTSVVKDNDLMQDYSSGHGGMIGFEIFDKYDFKAVAQKVTQTALTLMTAKDMKPQILDVVLHNGFGGVIFHEACGHPLEATAVAKGLSPFANRIGDKIASDKVTAYDDGTIIGSWGSLNFDDEGMPSQKNILIENGVLKNYLIDYNNGLKMKMAPTGSGRRESYKYLPTSRMTSTYIASGNDDFEDIIKNTKHGLFAKSLGGGTVSPATGEFNFVVREGFMIEDGKITYPVKGAMLIGQGNDILHHIDMVSNNLELSEGMCGSISGSVPVDVGQPTIRVKNMTVGGAGGDE